MVSLSSVGCGVFLWLGVMDQRACDQLVKQEASLDTLMWLKLLSVPTLGIIILTLFLLEEYFYSYAGDQEAALQQAAAAAQQAQLQQMQQMMVEAGGTVAGTTGTTGEAHGALCAGSNGSAGGGSGRKGSRALLESSTTNAASGKSGSTASPGSSSASAACGGSGASGGAPSSPQSYPHPLTLLSPARLPVPSAEYPLHLPPGGEFAPLCNPQDLLAGATRAARMQATMAGAAAAQGAQTLLLGAPAHFAPCPSSAPHALRVHLMNEAGVSTIVTCPSTGTTIKELMVFYASKNNLNLVSHAANSAAANSGANGTIAPPSLSHSLYTFSYHGRRIDSDKATLLSVGLVRDMEILHVALDYAQLHANLRREMAREIGALRVQAAAQEDTRDREEKRWKERMEELERVEGALAAAQSAVDSSLAEKARVQSEIESTKARVQSETVELQRLHKAKLCAEGSDADRIEHKRYEKLLSTLNKEHAALASEVDELGVKAAKVEREKNQLLREIATVEDKNKHMEEETAQLAHFAPPEMQQATQGQAASAAGESASASATDASSFPPMSALVSQLERLERAHVEFLAVRKKIDMITGEIAHKRAEIHALSKKVSMSAGLVTPVAGSAGATAGGSPALAAAVGGAGGAASGSGEDSTNAAAAAAAALSSIPTAALVAAATSSKASTSLDHSLPSLRARALALERETKDLLRWKTIAKHLEMEGKESARWKALWKAAGAREAALQAQLQGSAGGNSAAQWKLRARAFEKEVRELQAWKRALALQQSSAAGAGPASPLGDFYAAAQPSPLSNITYDTTDLPSLDAGTAGLAMGLGGNAVVGGVGSAGMGLGLGGLAGGELQLLGEDGTAGGSVAAAAAAAGLLLTDDLDDDDLDGERIEPQARHLAQASNEEEERVRMQSQLDLAPSHPNGAALAASVGTSNGLIDPSDPAASAILASTHARSHERISAELLAAEAEEERLVQSMRDNTGNSNNNGASSVSSSVGSSPSHSSVGGRSHSHLTSSGGSSNSGDGGDEEELLRLGEALVRRNQHLQQHRLMVRYQQQQAAQQAQQMQRDMETIQHMQAQQAQQVQQQEQMHNYASKNGAGVGVLQASAPVFTPRFQSDTSMGLQAGGGNASGSTGGSGGSGGPGSASKLASHYTKVGSSVSPFGAGSASSLHTSPSLPPSPPIPNPILSWNSHSPGSSSAASATGAGELDPSAYWLPRDDAELDSGSHHGGGGGGGGLHSSSHAHSGTAMRNRSFSNPAHSYPLASQQLHSHSSHLSSLPPSHPHAGLAHSGASSSLLAGLPPLASVVSADPFTAFRRSQNLIIVDDDESAGGSSGGGGASESLHTLSGPSAPFAPQFGGPYSGTHAHFGSGGPGAPAPASRHPSLASSGSAHVSRVHSGATSPVVSTLFGGAGGGGLPTFFSLSQQGVAAANAASRTTAHTSFHQHDSHS